ncbi:MAG: hypothetical protein M1836_007022 [Candelina mexicana]|nr:MAG: hypothetical protein M1836_007022 [Candelina mexicana]
MPALHQLAHLIERQQGQVGVLPPPPGVTQNFVNPETNAHGVVAVIYVFLILTILFVGARFYAKLAVNGKLGWDDFFSLFALITSITYSSLVLYSVDHNGLGRHMWDVPAQTFPQFMQFSLAESVLYAVAIFFAKLSLMIMFLHLFGVNITFRRTLYGIIAVISTYTIVNSFLIIFQCNPVRKAWDIMTPGHCPLNIVNIAIANGAVNIATDITLLVLPVPMIWQLHLPVRAKLAVIGILMTGTFGCIVAIIRQVEITHLVGDTDATWRYGPALMWLIMETNICIICGCAPILRPLFKRALNYESRIGSRPSEYKTNSKLSGRLAGSNPLSKPNRSMESQLVDGDYIELGGHHGSRGGGIDGRDTKRDITIMAESSSPTQSNPMQSGRILKTETFDVSDAAYNHRKS